MSDQKIPTNVANKYVGRLAHDANVFDRTCSTCKGMYNSQTTAVCPKCGAALVYMTTGKGTPFSITECTFYPLFGKATMERWAADLAKLKGGLPITWRFKMFNYADKNGVLAPAPITPLLKKGATVELRIYNHPPVPRMYDSVKNAGQKMLEMMYVVLPNYGDSIKFIKEPTTVTTKVDEHGKDVKPSLTQTPVQPAQPAQPDVAAIVAAVIQQLGMKAAPAAAQPVVTTKVAATATAVNDDEIESALYEDLYGDIEAGNLGDDLPDSTMGSMASVNPWN